MKAKELTNPMVQAFYRIRDGQHHLVDLTSAKALQLRGLVSIVYTYNVNGKEVPSARRFYTLVDSISGKA